MRTLYDSLNPAALPDEPGTLVASYIDGRNAPAAGWGARFKNAQVVRIARNAGTDAGDVGDCESTDLTPQTAVDWVRLRRSAGADPTIYCNESTWPSVRSAFANADMAQPHYWIAAWNNQAAGIDGAVAHQFADSGLTGQDYDESVVTDDAWLPAPAVAPSAPAPAPAPAAPPAFREQVVVKGDTLSHIAAEDGESLAEVEHDNPQIANPDLIYPGEAVNIETSAPATAPAPSGALYSISHAVPGYVTAADAVAGHNSNGTVPPGTYAVFNRADGMVNITRQAGVPGWWINPAS